MWRDRPDDEWFQENCAGKVAGSVKDKWRKIAIDGQHYLANELAWSYVTGHWPTGRVEPINGDKDDARRANLKMLVTTETALVDADKTT